jgi:hypothetical protein
MFSGEVASGQGYPPFDDSTDQAADSSADSGDSFDDGGWDAGFADDSDPSVANPFTTEVENVNAADWGVDSALIWGEDNGSGVVEEGGGGVAFDFPL